MTNLDDITTTSELTNTIPTNEWISNEMLLQELVKGQLKQTEALEKLSKGAFKTKTFIILSVAVMYLMLKYSWVFVSNDGSNSIFSFFPLQLRTSPSDLLVLTPTLFITVIYFLLLNFLRIFSIFAITNKSVALSAINVVFMFYIVAKVPAYLLPNYIAAFFVINTILVCCFNAKIRSYINQLDSHLSIEYSEYNKYKRLIADQKKKIILAAVFLSFLVTAAILIPHNCWYFQSCQSALDNYNNKQKEIQSHKTPEQIQKEFTEKQKEDFLKTCNKWVTDIVKSMNDLSKPITIEDTWLSIPSWYKEVPKEEEKKMFDKCISDAYSKYWQ